MPTVARTPRILLAGLLAVPVLLVGTAPDACACSCAERPLAAQVDDAQVVLRGRLVSSGPSAGWASRDSMTYVFAVDRVYKGVALDTQEVTSARERASCGLSGLVEGRDYLVLGTQQDDGILAGLCDGTRPADAASIATATRVAGPGHGPAPAPPPADQQGGARSALTWLLVAPAVLALVVALRHPVRWRRGARPHKGTR